MCRVRDPNLEAAHTIGRGLQDQKPEDGKDLLYVHPDSVVPLCRSCHGGVHAHALDLLPYLKREEEVDAVRAVGIARAYKRLSLPTWLL